MLGLGLGLVSEKFKKFKYGTFLTQSLKLMQWYVTSSVVGPYTKNLAINV